MGRQLSIVGKELINFAMRLHTQTEKLKAIKLSGKLNGAVGSFNAHAYSMPNIDWVKFSKDFVRKLGFEPNLYTTQINPYEDIIELFQNIKRLNGVVLDLDRDMWRYISDDWFVQEVKEGERGSSTLTQKVNPIDFENGEGNVQMGSAVLDALGTILADSRLQRDLSDSTIIRNSGLAMAFGLIGYKSTLEGLSRVKPDEQQMLASLNKNWAILTEPVQIALRYEGGLEDAYNEVAKRSRGVKIAGQDEWREWVDKLPIRDDLKERFKELTPETYVGYAERLTEMALKEIRDSRTKVT